MSHLRGLVFHFWGTPLKIRQVLLKGSIDAVFRGIFWPRMRGSGLRHCKCVLETCTCVKKIFVFFFFFIIKKEEDKNIDMFFSPCVVFTRRFFPAGGLRAQSAPRIGASDPDPSDRGGCEVQQPGQRGDLHGAPRRDPGLAHAHVGPTKWKWF